ncbi:hypothetical protein A2906_01995 [Candidatus Nomurabacteria bacterium RIFCSPLOWO2_01_FULL_37_25]|nr:MAG: hypothetical protein A2906_01995 [Candidatus Nomurabacteria bacterium RIFCSPLOWO2_01_FULL_37_25]
MPFVFMNDDKQNSNQGSLPRQKDGVNWIPGMQIFGEISTWIAVPIILALIAGKALDKHYGTKPIMLLVSAGVAFLISAYGIVKAVKKFNAKIQPPKFPLSGELDGSPSPDKGRVGEGLHLK